MTDKTDKPVQTVMVTGEVFKSDRSFGRGQSFQTKLNEQLMRLQLNGHTIITVTHTVEQREIKVLKDDTQHHALILYK